MNTNCCQVKQSYLKLFPGKGEAWSAKNCKLEKMELVRAMLELSPDRFVLKCSDLNAAHFVRNLTRAVYTNLTLSFPERADHVSAKFT